MFDVFRVSHITVSCRLLSPSFLSSVSSILENSFKKMFEYDYALSVFPEQISRLSLAQFYAQTKGQIQVYWTRKNFGNGDDVELVCSFINQKVKIFFVSRTLILNEALVLLVLFESLINSSPYVHFHAGA